MAEIPIWPGSSSFTTVSASYYNTPSTGSAPTAFGIYDSDADFKTDADKIALWCSRKMGYPIVGIELQDINFWSCFESAVTEYSAQVNQYNMRDHLMSLKGVSTADDLSQRLVTSNLGGMIDIAENYGTEAGSGGKIAYKTGSIAVTSSIQVYDLQTKYADVFEGGEAIEIKKVFYEGPPAISRYFDPFVGTGLGTQQLLNSFGYGSFSPAVNFVMMPVYADLLRIQAIEFNDQIRKSAYSFDITGTEIRIHPIPNSNYTLFFHYIVKSDRNNPLSNPTGSVSDHSNANYTNISYNTMNDLGKQWVWQYTLALAMETLANVRGKFGNTVPLPDEDISLNAPDLYSQATAEKERLLTELRETLELLSRKSLMENEQLISQNLQDTLNRVPMKIYIF